MAVHTHTHTQKFSRWEISVIYVLTVITFLTAAGSTEVQSEVSINLYGDCVLFLLNLTFSN